MQCSLSSISPTCLLSTFHHFYSLPILLPSLRRSPPSLPACPPPSVLTPHHAVSHSPCNICLSFGMKRKCLPVGSQVVHPKGWLRLMPVIQLCWFTPHIYRGVGDYTVLCWREQEADRWNQSERARIKEWERDRCRVADEARWVLY